LLIFVFRPLLDRVEPRDFIDQHDTHPVSSSLISLSEKSVDYKNDQMKLRLLIEQFEKRLNDEKSHHKRLLNCVQQTTRKFEQLNGFPKTNMLTLVMSDDPAVVEYQKALCLSDYQIYKSVEDELNVALRETQHRIDWIEMVRARAHQCLDQA
jgi:cell division inhibitor SulA